MSMSMLVTLINQGPATLPDQPGAQDLTVCPLATIILTFSQKTTPPLASVLKQDSPRGCVGVSYTQHITVAIVFYFADTVKDYRDLGNDQMRFAALLITLRPERCPNCSASHPFFLWGSYLRWVYLHDERYQVRIERVRCVMCGVSHALLPSFLHIFRRYILPLIQQATTLALEKGVWGEALADAVAPYYQPALSTLREWVYSFIRGADKLTVWLQHTLLTLDPLACLDPGPPAVTLSSIRLPSRRAAFSRGRQFLRLAEPLYALTRMRQPELVFHFKDLFAFLTLALQTAGRLPRLLWRAHPSRAPT